MQIKSKVFYGSEEVNQSGVDYYFEKMRKKEENKKIKTKQKKNRAEDSVLERW